MDASKDTKLGGALSALAPGPVGGRRRSHKHKLRLVKKKTVRRMLKKMGLKMRGGEGGEGAVPAPAAAPAAGGRRHRSRRSRKFNIFA